MTLQKKQHRRVTGSSVLLFKKKRGENEKEKSHSLPVLYPAIIKKVSEEMLNDC